MIKDRKTAGDGGGVGESLPVEVNMRRVWVLRFTVEPVDPLPFDSLPEERRKRLGDGVAGEHAQVAAPFATLCRDRGVACRHRHCHVTLGLCPSSDSHGRPGNCGSGGGLLDGAFAEADDVPRNDRSEESRCRLGDRLCCDHRAEKRTPATRQRLLALNKDGLDLLPVFLYDLTGNLLGVNVRAGFERCGEPHSGRIHVA